jgi:CheY-like chemotaxis protein
VKNDMAKILLIDDDPDIRTVMGMILKKEGYEVTTASRREEALEKLAVEKPSLILLDVLLSGADGRELCREIKASDTTKNIPVIMLSGHPGAAQQFETYGANDFLAKPFTTEVLLSKLSKQMGVVK